MPGLHESAASWRTAAAVAAAAAAAALLGASSPIPWFVLPLLSCPQPCSTSSTPSARWARCCYKSWLLLLQAAEAAAVAASCIAGCCCYEPQTLAAGANPVSCRSCSPCSQVVGSPEEDSRLLLCEATALTMRACFQLLGIHVLYRI